MVQKKIDAEELKQWIFDKYGYSELRNYHSDIRETYNHICEMQGCKKYRIVMSERIYGNYKEKQKPLFEKQMYVYARSKQEAVKIVRNMNFIVYTYGSRQYFTSESDCVTVKAFEE